MNELLNQVYFDNTVRSYIVVGITIAIAILFKKYLALYIARLIFKLVKKRYTNIDLPTFLVLTAKPLGLFIASVITVGALDKLTYPEEFNFRIWNKLHFHDLLQMAASFLVIFTFFRLIIKAIDFIMLAIRGRYLADGDKGNHQLIFFFKDLIKVIIGLVGGMFILKYTFNYDIKSLLTGLSIVGAAIALALKENLENLIASFIIFFDKPFATGDYVKLSNVSGTVEKIGLRSTRLRSDSKSYITVPNKQMADGIVDNQSFRTQRQVELKLELPSTTPPEEIEPLLDGIRNLLKTGDIMSPTAYVTNVTAGSILLTCIFYTGADYTEFCKIRERATLEILALMKQKNITTAKSVSDVNIIHNTDIPGGAQKTDAPAAPAAT